MFELSFRESKILREGDITLGIGYNGEDQFLLDGHIIPRFIIFTNFYFATQTNQHSIDGEEKNQAIYIMSDLIFYYRCITFSFRCIGKVRYYL